MNPWGLYISLFSRRWKYVIGNKYLINYHLVRVMLRVVHLKYLLLINKHLQKNNIDVFD